MNIEELIKQLGLDEAKAGKLKEFVQAKEAETTKNINHAKEYRTKFKTAETELKSVKEKLEKLCDALGVDETADDLDEAIKTALKDKSADPALQRQINKLQNKIKEQTTEFNTKFSEERGRRYDGMKRTALLEALTKNNAADAGFLVDALIGKLKVNEDDESLVFEDDKNPKIEDFVKAFLTEHPNMILNQQKGGAGSLLGGSSGGNTDDTSFAKELASEAKGGTGAEASAKALDSYFS